LKRLLTLALAGLLAVVVAAPAGAAKPESGPITPDLIWADGELLGTVLLNPLPFNGKTKSYDQLFMIEGQMNPVAEAAPGNKAYNGGRWLPTPVERTDTFPADHVIRSYADLMEAHYEGWVIIGEPDTGNAFLCPLIPNH